MSNTVNTWDIQILLPKMILVMSMICPAAVVVVCLSWIYSHNVLQRALEITPKNTAMFGCCKTSFVGRPF